MVGLDSSEVPGDEFGNVAVLARFVRCPAKVVTRMVSLWSVSLRHFIKSTENVK